MEEYPLIFFISLVPFVLRHHAHNLAAIPAGRLRERSQTRCDNGHRSGVTLSLVAGPASFVIGPSPFFGDIESRRLMMNDEGRVAEFSSAWPAPAGCEW